MSRGIPKVIVGVCRFSVKICLNGAIRRFDDPSVQKINSSNRMITREFDGVVNTVQMVNELVQLIHAMFPD